MKIKMDRDYKLLIKGVPQIDKICNIESHDLINGWYNVNIYHLNETTRCVCGAELCRFTVTEFNEDGINIHDKNITLELVKYEEEI